MASVVWILRLKYRMLAFRVSPERLVNQAHLGPVVSKATKVHPACVVQMV